MNKIEFLKETIEKSEQLLIEVEIYNAPIDAINMMKDSINTYKILLESCMEKEIETGAVPVAEVKLNEEASGLIVGRIFKNYKELCSFMGWKIQTGKAKKLQFQEFERICKHHKEGNKIVVDEVYQVAIAKPEDGRINNKGNGKKSIYYQDFEILMLHLLENAPNDYLDFTITQLMQIVGMVNKDYCKYKYSQRLLAEETQISTEEINQFYEVHQKLLSQGARTCLNNLKKAYLIHLNEITMIRAFDIVSASSEGKKAKRKYFDRVATKEEIKKILIEKRCLMESMGCKNMNEIYKKNLNLKFHRELRTILEDKYNISFDYTSYRAVLNKESITEELKKIAEIAKTNELIESINCKSYNKSINGYNYKAINRLEPMEGFRDLQSNAKALSNKLILV